MSKLSAENLFKTYGKKTTVRDMSLSVSSGEIVGLLGPNGAGKTTCFYLIVGLVSADSGKIHIDDTPITHLPMHQRAELGIGYLPQEPSVFRRLTVAENILAVLELNKLSSRAERMQRLEELLNDFSITHIRDSLGMSLSGGERRRVEIARALAANPKIILLDEPFAGVDPISVEEIKTIIRKLTNKNIGVLITDHNVRETLDICEKAYIMAGGAAIISGSTSEILANKEVREVYLGEDFKI